jgi:hypothetical protein
LSGDCGFGAGAGQPGVDPARLVRQLAAGGAEQVAGAASGVGVRLGSRRRCGRVAAAAGTREGGAERAGGNVSRRGWRRH